MGRVRERLGTDIASASCSIRNPGCAETAAASPSHRASSSPGVLGALLVLALAFHRRNPILLGLALLFLVGFAVAFYFRLDLSLAAKSGVLLASGALLLGLREYVRRRFARLAEEDP